MGSKRGSGQDLLALRDYRHDDDIRHIDWKATARTRTLTVREFASEDDRQVTVLFDTRMPQNDEHHPTLREKLTAEQSGKPVVLSARFEKGISLCSSLLTQLADQRSAFRLIMGDTIGEFGSSRRHLYESLKLLALAEPEFIDGPGDGEPWRLPGRIQEDNDVSHWYVFAADGGRSGEPGGIRSLKMVTF